MSHDAQGLECTAQDAGAVAAYDDALASFFEFRLTSADHVKAALAADPDFVMGICFRAYLLMQFGSRQIFPNVDPMLDRLKALTGHANARERAHIAALGHWREGRVGDACRVWESILVATPAGPACAAPASRDELLARAQGGSAKRPGGSAGPH